MLRTAFTDLLGIALPTVQAGMGGVALAELAAGTAGLRGERAACIGS